MEPRVRHMVQAEIVVGSVVVVLAGTAGRQDAAALLEADEVAILN